VGDFLFAQHLLTGGASAMTTARSTGRIETLNGVPIYFEVHRNGEPLLLLHGFSGCSQDWLQLMGVEASGCHDNYSGSWGGGFQLIIPDMRGQGRSGTLTRNFGHDDAAGDMFALLDHLGIETFKGVGVSAGGNVLLHMATKQPERVSAMVLVSATSYFPAQARPIIRQYPEQLRPEDRELLRRRNPGGDAQIEAILKSTKAFVDSYDDMNFTPADLATITARTLIVQGDRDPLYPMEISVEMAKAIPRSSLWIVPAECHGPIGGERWPEFLKKATAFLRVP
jgi:pimeloyl-ACP methyl ester carboxylesterase